MIQIITKERKTTSPAGDILFIEPEEIGVMVTVREELLEFLDAKTCQYCNKPLDRLLYITDYVYCSKDCAMKHG